MPREEQPPASRQLVPDGPPAVVVSQIVWRALGPQVPRRPRIVGEWVGLGGAAPVTAELLSRHQVSKATLYGWRAIVTDHARRFCFPPGLVEELTRPTAAGEDHLGRRRRALLLDLPIPARQPARKASPGDLGLIRIITRLLAVLGPTPVAELLDAVHRSRTRTDQARIVTVEQLAALLWTADGMTIDPDGTCRLTRAVPAYPPDLRLLELADRSGRADHDRPQMVELLAAIGYSRSIEPTLVWHPLLIHTARGHWRIRTPRAGRPGEGTAGAAAGHSVSDRNPSDPGVR